MLVTWIFHPRLAGDIFVSRVFKTSSLSGDLRKKLEAGAEWRISSAARRFLIASLINTPPCSVIKLRGLQCGGGGGGGTKTFWQQEVWHRATMASDKQSPWDVKKEKNVQGVYSLLVEMSSHHTKITWILVVKNTNIQTADGIFLRHREFFERPLTQSLPK